MIGRPSASLALGSLLAAISGAVVACDRGGVGLRSEIGESSNLVSESADEVPEFFESRADALELAPPLGPLFAAPGLPAAPMAAAAVGSPTDPDALTVTRSRCEAAGCELVFSFSRPMVEASKLARAKPAAIVFDPPQPGRWKWRSPTELVFQPKDGSLLWGHEIDIRLAAATPLAGKEHALAAAWSDPLQVPNFSVAGKWASWPVEPGSPRFVAILDRYSEEIGRGPIYLAFDQEVDPLAIARHVSARSGDKSHKVAVWRPVRLGRIWSDEVDTRSIVAVRVTGLPANGAGVLVSYPAQIIRGKAADVELANRTFTVRKTIDVKEISLQRESDGGRAPVRARWEIALSGEVASEAAAQSVTLDPKPDDLSIYSYGTNLVVSATLVPGGRYVVRVAAGLRDNLGNKLSRETQKAFTAQDLAPVIELPSNRALVLESGRARIPFRAVNLADVSVRAHSIGDVAAYIRAVADGGTDCEIPASVGAALVSRRTARNQRVSAQASLALSRRGPACVEVTATGSGSEKTGQIKKTMLTQVTDLGITAKVHRGGVMAWVSRLSDAAPVAGAVVALRTADGALVSSATTDRDGVARLAGKDTTSRGSVAASFIVAKTADDLALTELSDQRVSQPWQFGLRGDVETSEPLTAAVFTDRGVYRPKEKVHVVVIARDVRAGGGLVVPADKTVRVTISDARGNAVSSEKLALDAFGSADATVELKENAAVGKYTVRVEQGDQVTVRHFAVEEYRVPTFEVKVAADEPSWTTQKRARISITADYLHGGKLASRRVAYTVSRTPAPMTLERFSEFGFGMPNLLPPEGQILAAEGKLDGQGQIAFDFRPTHPAAAGPMRYVIDAHVTDVDRQAYAGRLARVVHPSDIYVGVRQPRQTIISEGQAINVPVIAITSAGVAKAGVDVTVTAEAIDNHTTARLAGDDVERHNREVTRAVASCKVTSADAAQSCALRLARAGHYRIVARAKDGKKREVAAGFEITVGGNGLVAWPRFDHERIEILADKASYKAGDVASLAIQSPFAKARGILTLERGDVIEHRSFEIDNNTPILKVPIKAEHAPNVYASVVLLRGRVHDKHDATGFETGAPAFRVGYTQLGVEPDAARLAVKVTTDKSIAAPGGKLAVAIDLADASGNPVTGQAVLMVVDEAVLGMTRYKTPDPIAELYRKRDLGVRTASSRLDLPHSRRERREPLFPGGGGDDWDGDGGDDGGQGDADSELSDMRRLFESTAYFNPRVAIKGGHASVEIALPDNVTTFRVMAVALDSGARAGASETKVVVRKPVMVKAVVPRFAYPGDKIEVAARVFNGTLEPGSATIEAAFTGMRRKNRSVVAPQAVAAGGSTMFTFPIEVTGSGTAVFRFAARIGGETDSVEVEIPILDPGTRRKTVETLSVSGEGTIDLKLPKSRIAGSTSLEILASATSLSELRGAVDYVMDYPNGCIEQTTSTAYPLIVLEDLLPDMGVTVDAAKLKEYASAGVKRLLSFQTTSGGLAYWPGSDEPHAFGTAFALTALIEAKARGYEVPDKALAEMAAYLEASLKQGTISDEMPHGGMADADTRALFVMTLGRLGRSRPADVATLWREKSKLTGFGLSFLAVAASEGHGDRALLSPILDEIHKRATETKEEAFFKGQRDQGWSMGSPLRTHAAALLAFASAKPKGSGGQMSPKLLKGLIGRQQGGMWGNTQENVFGIMAVAKAIERKGVGGQTPELSLTLNGAAIAASSLEKLTKQTLRHRSVLADEAGAVVGIKNGGGAPTIVTVRAEYDQPLTPKTMKARNDGFAVARRYESLAGKVLEGGAIPLGEVIAVRLEVTTTSKFNYVAIADRLPAGLEPLNGSLATTEKVAGRVASAGELRGLSRLDYSETRDARVSFYANELPAGTYEFTYLARATTAGTFRRPAAQADAMYEPDAVGTSSIDSVVIK